MPQWGEGESGPDAAAARAAAAGRVDPLAHLIDACQRGDSRAIEQVLTALAPRLLAIARKILGPAAMDTEDALQESLIAVARALPSFRGQSSVGLYAARIGARVCVTARARRRPELPATELLEYQPPPPGHAQHGAQPHGLALAEQRRELLRQLIATLPDEQGETLVMRYMLGMSLIEVSAATGAPVNTVRSRVRLAKQALRQRIEQHPAAADLLGEALP